jgi:DDE superfamily endonuclease
MIASKLCSSTHDSTAYIVTQLSKDIKSGKLPKDYHVVLDEAYPCTEQEMSPWKGRKLSTEKDAFNYYMSLNRQVIERAFGILVQRWGIFWRPLRLSMKHRGTAIRVACKLHNVCIGYSVNVPIQSIHIRSVPGFETETDKQPGDEVCYNLTDGTPITRGYRSDLETCHHRDQWTKIIKEIGLTRPNFTRFSKKALRK